MLVLALPRKRLSGDTTPAQLAQAIANANVGASPLAPTGTGWRTATAYDATGAPVQITTNPGSVDGSKFFTVERMQYDADGNLLADQDPRYPGATPSADGLGGFDLSDGHGNPIAKNISAEGYDTRGLLIAQTDPAGNETLYGRLADGKICWMMAPNGVAYQQSQGNKLPSSSDCTSTTQKLPYTTAYTYNAPGWLATVTVPEAPNERDFGTDTMNVSYERDQAGYPISITDARGNTFTNAFYDNGELKSTTRPSWWTYDPQSTGTPGPDPNTGGQGGVASDTPGAGLPIREKTPQEQYQAAAQAQAGSPLPQTGDGQGDYGAVSSAPPPGLLPAAGSTTFAYDGDGSLSSVTNAQGPAATLSYDADEQLSGMSLPCGCTDATATYATSNTSYSYDPDGNIQSVTTPPVDGTGGDSAPTTTYAYDALDREIHETAPGGNAGPKPYSPVVGPYQHAVTYTSYALAPSAPAVPGSGFGSPTSFNVAEQVSVTDARGDTKADAGASECPSDVNPSDTSTPCWGQGAGDPSHTTTSEYDALGNLIEQQGPLVTDSGQSTPQRETTTYEYDQSGDQTRVVAPLGNQPFASGSGQDLHYATTSTYDPDGRMSSSAGELADGTQIVTDFSYDHDGNESEIMRPAADSAGDPEVTMYTYDGRDLPWTTTTGVTAAGQATNVTRTTITEYDGNGNVHRTVNPAGVSQNMSALGPADTTGQGGAYYPYEATSSDSGYDNAATPSKQSSETSEQDANIDATIRVYNADNLLTAVYQPWGCNLTQSNSPSKCTDAQITDTRRFRQLFARDSLGRVQTATDSYDWTNKSAQQNQTNYAYTSSGWISSETDPAVSPSTGETTSYQYDPAGDQTSWQQSGTLPGSNAGKPLGQDTTSAYYPDEQLAQTHAAGLQGVAVEHTYTYYHLPTGELDYAQTDAASTSSAPGETQNLTYDDDGRLVAVNENIPPGAIQGGTPSPYDTTQAYDADGNLAQRRTNGSITPGSGLYTGGQTTSFTYDTLGRETTMTVAPNPATASTTPDSCPAPAGAQPCRFFNTTKYAPSGQIMAEQRWQGDPNNPSGQITEDYTYNDDGTLASDNRTGGDNLSVTYSYDTDANRTTDERGTHQFNALNQEVLWTRGGPDTQAPGSTVAYVHDGDGSLLQTVQNTYTKAIPITPAQPGYPNATQDESFQTTTQYCSEATAKLANTQGGSWQGCQHDAGRVERINSAQITTVTAVNNAAPGTTLPGPSTTYTTQDYCYDQLGENRRIVQAGNTTVTQPRPPPMDPHNACPADPLAQGYQGENPNTTTLYGYDSFGREVSSAGPDPASQNPSSPTIVTDNYSYDALDRRYQKTESTSSQTTTTNYDYIADSDLVSQDTSLNPQSQPITDTYDYSSTGQRKGANAQAPSGSNTYHTYALDANGSVSALENSAGGVSAGDSYHYDPYGNLELGASELQKAVSGGNFATATPENQLASDAQANKYRFEGFYYDSGVETYDMQARPYRPDTGQFLVSDRFQDALGDQELAADPLTQNRYAFAGGNPTSNVEYDGHEPQSSFTDNRCVNSPYVTQGSCSEAPVSNNIPASPTFCQTHYCDSTPTAPTSNSGGAAAPAQVTIRGTVFTFYPAQAIEPGHPATHPGQTIGVYLPPDVTLADYKADLVPSGDSPVGTQSNPVVDRLGAGALSELPADAGIVLPPPSCTAVCQVAGFVLQLAIPDGDGLDAGQAVDEGAPALEDLLGGGTVKAEQAAGDGANVYRGAASRSGGAGISLGDAAAAAERNGIDTRMFELGYEPGGGAFGFISQTGSGALIRGATGRILLTLQDLGLTSEQDAVETIAHELNHVRGILATGLPTSEATAEGAAQAAGRYFR